MPYSAFPILPNASGLFYRPTRCCLLLLVTIELSPDEKRASLQTQFLPYLVLFSLLILYAMISKFAV
jgi:hypothetical protein